jgi:hypothetical protein
MTSYFEIEFHENEPVRPPQKKCKLCEQNAIEYELCETCINEIIRYGKKLGTQFCTHTPCWGTYFGKIMSKNNAL